MRRPIQKLLKPLSLGLVASLASGLPAWASIDSAQGFVPGVVWILPFVGILLAIAVIPLFSSWSSWWDKNSHKLLVSLALGGITCLYYLFRGVGFQAAAPGWPTLWEMLRRSILDDYIPFIVLLFTLFTISGGIHLRGEITPTPVSNTRFLAIGSILASFVGTTGAAVLLIRPLLQSNRKRQFVRHTVIFFIFIVCNIGGALLPLGDPPLFMGYLRGVPFFWTLHLWTEWLFCVGLLLLVYWGFDFYYYRKEPEAEKLANVKENKKSIQVEGKLNFLLLLGVILAVAFVVPEQKIPGTALVVPKGYWREGILLCLAGLSMWATDPSIRRENQFNFGPIAEVASLFLGIFLTMQVPIEILQNLGPRIGLSHPAQFFWSSGALSSVLDNTPTYVVFFEAAKAMGNGGGLPMMFLGSGGMIAIPYLVAISCGSVFMGANTYIGNGPNFLVKSIAESQGISMPTFFGYMVYSLLILIPLFAMVTLVFFRI